MTGRLGLVAGASALLSRAKALDLQRNELLDQLQAARRRIEEQRHEAGLIDPLLARSDLPSLKETERRLGELRELIESEKQQRLKLKAESAELQSWIDASISLREKKAQSEKVAADVKSLSVKVQEERQKEHSLQFRQSQLSSQLLKAQLLKKNYEQQLASEPEPAVDVGRIEKKKKSLIDQTRLVQAKREAFEQELTASVDELEELKIRKAKLTEMAERVENSDPPELRCRILLAAADNLDLRAYRPPSREADSLIGELSKLSDNCSSLIERTYSFLD
jgi:DNA repair exonuclease SbcCD ATPase subunit